MRKTIYNTYFYGTLEQSITGTLAVKIDYDRDDIIQPIAVTQKIGEGVNEVATYGGAVYGEDVYGGKPLRRFYYTTIGAGNTFSFRIFGDSDNEDFNFNSIVIEYQLNGRS